MTSPARAVRYFRELHRRGLLAATIKDALADRRRFGAMGQVRYALAAVGVENYMPVRYPVEGATVRVRIGPFWKYWKGLEAGSQDFESLRFLASFVKPAQTVLDVGAWEGPYTFLLSRLVGARGHIHAFEPDPRAGRMLRSNVAANGLANVTVEDRCLSDREGEASFYDSSGGTIGSLVRNELVAGLPKVVVKTTTIDRYATDRALAVDGMKVDVEGAEALVLAGAKDVIARNAPWLFLEFHGVLMEPDVRARSWAQIAGSARSVTFVSGRSRQYRVGDRVDGYPDCDYFHALIQY